VVQSNSKRKKKVQRKRDNKKLDDLKNRLRKKESK